MRSALIISPTLIADWGELGTSCNPFLQDDDGNDQLACQARRRAAAFDLLAFDTGYIRFERVSTGPGSPAYNAVRGVS